jgi:hypothetical protein
LKFARNEQNLADLELDWSDFTLKGAMIGLCGIIVTRNGHTVHPIKYCIATCGVP